MKKSKANKIKHNKQSKKEGRKEITERQTTFKQAKKKKRVNINKINKEIQKDRKPKKVTKMITTLSYKKRERKCR